MVLTNSPTSNSGMKQMGAKPSIIVAVLSLIVGTVAWVLWVRGGSVSGVAVPQESGAVSAPVPVERPIHPRPPTSLRAARAAGLPETAASPSAIRAREASIVLAKQESVEDVEWAIDVFNNHEDLSARRSILGYLISRLADAEKSGMTPLELPDTVRHRLEVIAVQAISSDDWRVRRTAIDAMLGSKLYEQREFYDLLASLRNDERESNAALVRKYLPRTFGGEPPDE